MMSITSIADPMGLGHRRAVAARATSGSPPGPVLLYVALRRVDLRHVVLAGVHHSELDTTPCGAGSNCPSRHPAGAHESGARSSMLRYRPDGFGSAD